MDRTMQEFETLSETAARLRCNPRTIRRRIADGTLTAYRFGPRAIRLDPRQVDAALTRQRVSDIFAASE